MLTGLFTASSALDAFQTSLDNAANNLANVNTTAFKRSDVNFEDLMYSGSETSQVGRGVRIADIPRNFAQGPSLATGKELDLQIDGQGFFTVQMPDGSVQYTRDGTFHRDSLGRMVTDQGYLLKPPITIPSDTTSINISVDGTVSVLTGSSPNTARVIGQIKLARFVNPQGLQSEPGNLYSETANSGTPTTGVPGTNAIGVLRQGSLEQSNVDVTSELTSLVSAQRAYGVNSRVVRTTDQMISSALDVIR